MINKYIIAEELYTTYCNAVGGKAFNGDFLPDWDTFSNDPTKEKQVNAWLAAADRAIEMIAEHDQKPAILPHQQRVVDEKTELDDKATKLSSFIGENPVFLTLGEEEQERLKVQNDLMWQYSEILRKRIASF